MTKKKNNFMGKIKKNPWMISTVVLAIVIIVLAVNMATSTISEEKANVLIADFVQSQVAGAAISNLVLEDNFYKAEVSIQGQIVPLYLTKDGKELAINVIPLVDEVKETETQTEVTQGELVKSDKPVTGLYIWSYCPYGVTALSPYAEVAKLLGDTADFKVYLYYAGHGEHEVQQNKIQACMQDLGYTTKYWDYAKTFVETIYPECSGDIDCDLEKSVELMNSLGINSEEVLSCVTEKGEALLQDDYNAAKELGVTGSPTLVVSGVKTSVSRTAEAFKGAVCSAYNAVPELCAEALDSTGVTTSGSC